MAPLPAAVAATRTAIRRALVSLRLPDDALVMTACSGGADSLALSAAAAFVAPRVGLRAGLVTIDHDLQPGSAERAREVAAWATEIGLAPARVLTVDARGRGEGPEAAARSARYRALTAAAIGTDASAVLLGHTLDDQAETVLLALARGSGPRGIAGMPEVRTVGTVRFVRPFLAVSREQTESACRELGLKPWSDPHNSDPAFARSRVRAAMPVLSDLLGSDLVANLARTAGLVAADTELLDRMAAEAEPGVTEGSALVVSALARLPDALRTRVLRRYALAVGAHPGALGAVHIAALDALIVSWRGQGPVGLPGGIEVRRNGDRLLTRRDNL